LGDWVGRQAVRCPFTLSFSSSSTHHKVDPSPTVSAFAEANAVVESWDFDRIIPCHGDVVDTGGKEAWRSTFADYAHLLATGSK
jgi:hypothetical protein